MKRVRWGTKFWNKLSLLVHCNVIIKSGKNLMIMKSTTSKQRMKFYTWLFVDLMNWKTIILLILIRWSLTTKTIKLYQYMKFIRIRIKSNRTHKMSKIRLNINNFNIIRTIHVTIVLNVCFCSIYLSIFLSIYISAIPYKI
mgnify:CR=1 FL=1